MKIIAIFLRSILLPPWRRFVARVERHCKFVSNEYAARAAEKAERISVGSSRDRHAREFYELLDDLVVAINRTKTNSSVAMHSLTT